MLEQWHLSPNSMPVPLARLLSITLVAGRTRGCWHLYSLACSWWGEQRPDYRTCWGWPFYTTSYETRDLCSVWLGPKGQFGLWTEWPSSLRASSVFYSNVAGIFFFTLCLTIGMETLFDLIWLTFLRWAIRCENYTDSVPILVMKKTNGIVSRISCYCEENDENPHFVLSFYPHMPASQLIWAPEKHWAWKRKQCHKKDVDSKTNYIQFLSF